MHICEEKNQCKSTKEAKSDNLLYYFCSLYARVSCARDRELKTGQILHSVANGSPPLQHL